ncbi:MAG TPA: polysaccharide deacetylase [Ruminococcaceae bacterium]|nr:polysaccharide deacetylase [Oscillospiraceae bacterium]
MRKKGQKILFCFLIIFALCGSGFAGKVLAQKNHADDVALPIIMYHEVKTQRFHSLAISRSEFAQDMAWLKKENYTPISMQTLIGYVHGKNALPSKPIILTFDDGYLNNYTYAYPILKQYGYPAVLSVIGKDTDNFSAFPSQNENYAHMTWDQLREVQQSGIFEIENHTYDLHAMGKGKRFGCKKLPGESLPHYQKALTQDIQTCQEKIQNTIGTSPTTFTYPYGNVSEESVPIIQKMHFQASLSCRYGINLINQNPDCLYLLKRISRLHNTSLQKSLQKAVKADA